eukprot:GHVL01027681.1.p1 GENE.GHVL01027681.1~~GHVL01027681.1.p1  ORF type:complete len:713 (-),score=133.17 GHVL01027681.1:1435-3573(-)
MLSKLLKNPQLCAQKRNFSLLRKTIRPMTLSISKIRHFCNAPMNEQTLEFRAETQKLLSIVAHSLYTDQEVFVRELISNASDALEKLRFLEASGQIGNDFSEKFDLKIHLKIDPTNNTFTIEDTGIGMSRKEIVDNLGTIAKSGSVDFLNDPVLNAKEKADKIIGQFGVGFYSTFVVSNKVEVFTKRFDDSQGWHWESDGSGTFKIRPVEEEQLPRGTRIVCHLKDDCKQFCDLDNIKKVAEKFSKFVSYPIYYSDSTGEEKLLTVQEPLWLNPKATTEQHESFFRFLCGNSYTKLMYSISFHTDAPLSIKSVFYIPEDPPNRLFDKSENCHVSLHCRRVMVKQEADDIIPRWLHWVRGIIDCDDIPLNISRENMQDTRLMNQLSAAVVTRILKFFQDQAKNTPEAYLKFHKKFSPYLKEGLIEELSGQSKSGGKFKDNLVKLLRFDCSTTDKPVSLAEYKENMKENQQNIYYFCSCDRNAAMSSPYMEDMKRRNRPVLLMYDDRDEFVATQLQTYKEHKLVAVDSQQEDFEPLLDEDDGQKSKNIIDNLNSEDQENLSKFVSSTLGRRVNSVKFSERLVNSPAVVTGFMSSSMRKIMKMTMQDAPLDSDSLPVTLELNPHNKIVHSINRLHTIDAKFAALLVWQLYDTASLSAGLVDNPNGVVSRCTEMLEKAAEMAESRTTLEEVKFETDDNKSETAQDINENSEKKDTN